MSNHGAFAHLGVRADDGRRMDDQRAPIARLRQAGEGLTAELRFADGDGKAHIFRIIALAKSVEAADGTAQQLRGGRVIVDEYDL